MVQSRPLVRSAFCPEKIDLISGLTSHPGCNQLTGFDSLPRDTPPANVARAALLAPHGGQDGPDHGELGGGAGLLAAG